MGLLFSLSLLQGVILITLILVAACFLSVYFSGIRYPANLPRYGEKEGATSFHWRTRKAYYVDCKSLYKDVYEKVRFSRAIVTVKPANQIVLKTRSYSPPAWHRSSRRDYHSKHFPQMVNGPAGLSLELLGGILRDGSGRTHDR